MARLSAITGDYTQTGTIIDRQQLVAVGGETTFKLTFVDGSEEVYLNGYRLMKGAGQDYTVDTAAGEVILNVSLEPNDELLLVGRSSANEIPYSRSSGESVVLENGQTEVIFASIETSAIEVYISGNLVDRGMLTSPQDYELRAGSTSIIDLKHTYPAGSIIEGIQGGRLAWVDADNLVVNDGVSSKSLSTRFAATQESRAFFMQTTGRNLTDISVGVQLKKSSIDLDGIPYDDDSGSYQILRLRNSYWDPQITTGSLKYTVSSFSVSGQVLNIVAVETVGGQLANLTYSRRIQ